jgi:two-component system, cell cycle sensor histidine kinase and response regulator CckA
MTGDKIHVLLVEDNPGDARLVKGMLSRDENGGFTVNRVSTLGEAMRALAPGSENQVILLDLGLPDCIGLETLRRIMPLAQDASVVVLTGFQDEELGIAAIREGAHDYIIKGQVDGRQLRRILRYSVERQKMQGELHAEIERRARVQQALERSQERYRLLLETAPMGIVITDERGKVVQANEEALRMFGYAPRELIGHTVEMLLPERFRISHQWKRSDYMKEPHARPMGVGMELLARRKDGTEFPVEISLGPLATEEGTLVPAVVVDITARKKMEEQLRIAQRMEAIGNLAGGVAHDFNNLLAVILGCSDLVLDALTPEHPAAKKVEMIRKAGASAADLTRQLLAFSRQQMQQPRVLDLAEIVRRSEVLLRRLIGENIEITISPDPSLGCIKADPGQIEQVLVNLAVNARDAMPQGGRLTIEARNCELDDSYKDKHQPVIPGRYIMLAVEDTGCGMDADTQSRIFDPFFTTKELGKGTGLGLATVYGIVKQSGGYIWVYSELNKGTTFKVFLPRVEQSAEPPKPDEPEGMALQGCETILLAEDSASLRQMAREYLESTGYTVLEASSGSEALEHAKDFQGPIHLLLTDVVMPGISGPELAAELASLRPGIRIIFTSGYTDDAIARQGVLDPAVAFIQKPYRPKALARKIREVLGDHAANGESPVLMHSRASNVS